MSAAEVLVIFLSVALAVFLALAIVLVIYLIIIAKRIKAIADTAGEGVRGFVAIVTTLQKAAAPAVISKFVMDQVNRFTERRSNNKKED